jgi:HSP20 family protein
MSTLNQLRQGLNDAWDSLVDGWQWLYRRAAGAITRFSTGEGDDTQDETEAGQNIALRSGGWTVLAAEVFDDADKVVVRLEIPGMEKEDFSVQMLDSYLVVRGKKQVEREHAQGRYDITECVYGSFERAIPLPATVDSDRAVATYTKRGTADRAAQTRRTAPRVGQG